MPGIPEPRCRKFRRAQLEKHRAVLHRLGTDEGAAPPGMTYLHDVLPAPGAPPTPALLGKLGGAEAVQDEALLATPGAAGALLDQAQVTGPFQDSFLIPFRLINSPST